MMRSQKNGSTKSLLQSVAEARDVCKMRFLVGAAPIVYGGPIYC